MLLYFRGAQYVVYFTQLCGTFSKLRGSGANSRIAQGEMMQYCTILDPEISPDEARHVNPPKSDSSQFLGTCSSFPLVFGCSNVAC